MLRCEELFAALVLMNNDGGGWWRTEPVAVAIDMLLVRSVVDDVPVWEGEREKEEEESTARSRSASRSRKLLLMSITQPPSTAAC
jgi:hypothetical protein